MYLNAAADAATLAPSAPPRTADTDAEMRDTLALWISIERVRLRIALCDLDAIESALRYRLLPADEIAEDMLRLGLVPPGLDDGDAA